MSRQRFRPLALAVLIGVAVTALRIVGCGPLDRLDMRALDGLLLQRGGGPPAPEVVIVAVDDASLKELGRWPWSRALMARLIDTIAAADPAVIGIDVIQSEATASCSLDALDGQVDAP